jgi:hypothetical protein
MVLFGVVDIGEGCIEYQSTQKAFGSIGRKYTYPLLVYSFCFQFYTRALRYANTVEGIFIYPSSLGFHPSLLSNRSHYTEASPKGKPPIITQYSARVLFEWLPFPVVLVESIP